MLELKNLVPKKLAGFIVEFKNKILNMLNIPISKNVRNYLKWIDNSLFENKYSFKYLFQGSTTKFKSKYVNKISEVSQFDEILITNSKSLKENFDTITLSVNFQELHTLLPTILSSLLIFNTSGTAPKIICLGVETYVIVNIKKDIEYVKNYALLKNLFENCECNVKVVDSVGVIKSGDIYYFISEFKGFDFETEIINHGKIELKKELFNISQKIEKETRKKGYLLRNISPRNLIKGIDDHVYIIDYDNIFDVSKVNDIEIFKADINRRLWFADIFTKSQIDKIFIHYKVTNISIEPNEYDLPFLPNEISAMDEFLYKSVFDNSVLIERSTTHRKNSNPYYGHLLGRIISDFWSEENEISFAKFVYNSPKYLKKIAEIMYGICMLDQELCLHHHFQSNLNKTALSLKFFQKLKNNSDLSNFENKFSKFISNTEIPFNDRYIFASKSLEI